MNNLFCGGQCELDDDHSVLNIAAQSAVQTQQAVVDRISMNNLENRLLMQKILIIDVRIDEHEEDVVLEIRYYFKLNGILTHCRDDQ